MDDEERENGSLNYRQRAHGHGSVRQQQHAKMAIAAMDKV
jgi:hypothetical protein